MAEPLATPLVRLTREPLDRDATIAAVAYPGAGAIVTFEGVVRDNADGVPVEYLEYEAFEEMALTRLREIADEVRARWGAERVALIHRLGRVEVGATSVLVVVATPHRPEGFDACRYAIDTLKHTVPIWKREVTPDGATWVEGA